MLHGNSWVVQWLALCASTAGGTGSFPGPGTKILQATQQGGGGKEVLLIPQENFPVVVGASISPHKLLQSYFKMAAAERWIGSLNRES